MDGLNGSWTTRGLLELVHSSPTLSTLPSTVVPGVVPRPCGRSPLHRSGCGQICVLPVFNPGSVCGQLGDGCAQAVGGLGKTPAHPWGCRNCGQLGTTARISADRCGRRHPGPQKSSARETARTRHRPRSAARSARFVGLYPPWIGASRLRPRPPRRLRAAWGWPNLSVEAHRSRPPGRTETSRAESERCGHPLVGPTSLARTPIRPPPRSGRARRRLSVHVPAPHVRACEHPGDERASFLLDRPARPTPPQQKAPARGGRPITRPKTPPLPIPNRPQSPVPARLHPARSPGRRLHLSISDGDLAEAAMSRPSTPALP